MRRERNRCSGLQSDAFRSAYGKSFPPVAGRVAGQRLEETQEGSSRGKSFAKREGMEAFLAFQDGLSSIALANGRTIGQLAVAWALRREEVTSAIVKPAPRADPETVRAAEKS